MILHSLLADKRFATVFDKSELEVVSFYVFILPVLKKSIIELFNQLNQQLNNDDTNVMHSLSLGDISVGLGRNCIA